MLLRMEPHRRFEPLGMDDRGKLSTGRARPECNRQRRGRDLDASLFH